MEALLKSLNQSAGVILLVQTLAIIILFVSLALLQSKFNRTQRRFKELLQSKSGQDLESLLIDHTRERLEFKAQLEGALTRVDKLEGRMEKAKRHIGLVKYDAFDDVGGKQSFALAIYDDRGDGVVVSSVLGRTDCRVYCKPIAGGKSERNLSNEEQQAILEAVGSAGRSFVSP